MLPWAAAGRVADGGGGDGGGANQRGRGERTCGRVAGFGVASHQWGGVRSANLRQLFARTRPQSDAARKVVVVAAAASLARSLWGRVRAQQTHTRGRRARTHTRAIARVSAPDKRRPSERLARSGAALIAPNCIGLSARNCMFIDLFSAQRAA